MSDLVECLVDGGVWIIGTLNVSREQFETMQPEPDGTFNAVLKHDGYLYYYDSIVPEYDFTHGTRNVTVNFHLSRDNIFAKRPE